MRSLLLYILQFGGFLLLLLLEGLCFILIVKYNQDQKVIYENSRSLITAWADRELDEFAGYLTLGKANDSLAAVNSRLYEQLLHYQQLVEELRQDSTLTPTLDSLSIDTVFQVIPARVIKNSVFKHHNFILLDKGSRHGVQPKMGVILDNGIVGVVTQVESRYSLVMSVLHRQSRPSALIRNTGYFGSLRWEEKNPKELLLENVPKHAHPNIGDTIISSGYSLFFPKGIPLGTIISVDTDGGSDTYKIGVELFADLARLDRVYVVKNFRQQEQEKLTQQEQDE